MIIRSWKARTTSPLFGDYATHFRQNVLPELKAIDGFIGATLLRENLQNHVNVVVQTRWTSMDAVEAFAGSDVAKAVVEPQAIAALTDYDREVQHFDLVEEVLKV